jgi:hypothetical protein
MVIAADGPRHHRTPGWSSRSRERGGEGADPSKRCNGTGHGPGWWCAPQQAAARAHKREKGLIRRVLELEADGTNHSGVEIDRYLAAAARNLGYSEEDIAALHPKTGRSVFGNEGDWAKAKMTEDRLHEVVGSTLAMRLVQVEQRTDAKLAWAVSRCAPSRRAKGRHAAPRGRFFDCAHPAEEKAERATRADTSSRKSRSSADMLPRGVALGCESRPPQFNDSRRYCLGDGPCFTAS